MSIALPVSTGLLDKPCQIFLGLVEASDVSYKGGHGDLLAVGVARLLSVGLILVDKNDFLHVVAARVLVDFIATNVSLVNARVILLNCCRNRIGNWGW